MIHELTNREAQHRLKQMLATTQPTQTFSSVQFIDRHSPTQNQFDRTNPWESPKFEAIEEISQPHLPFTLNTLSTINTRNSTSHNCESHKESVVENSNMRDFSTNNESDSSYESDESAKVTQRDNRRGHNSVQPRMSDTEYAMKLLQRTWGKEVVVVGTSQKRKKKNKMAIQNKAERDREEAEKRKEEERREIEKQNRLARGRDFLMQQKSKRAIEKQKGRSEESAKREENVIHTETMEGEKLQNSQLGETEKASECNKITETIHSVDPQKMIVSKTKVTNQSNNDDLNHYSDHCVYSEANGGSYKVCEDRQHFISDTALSIARIGTQQSCIKEEYTNIVNSVPGVNHEQDLPQQIIEIFSGNDEQIDQNLEENDPLVGQIDGSDGKPCAILEYSSTRAHGFETEAETLVQNKELPKTGDVM